MAKRTSRTEIPVDGNEGNNNDAIRADSGAGDIRNIVSGTASAGPDLIIIDPANIGDAGTDGGNSGSDTGEPIRKRRGRKPGSGRSAKAQTLDIKGVEGILYSAHTMLAALTKTQELALDKEEANRLAEGISNVSRHYDIAATQKSMDWANLIMVCGMIYGTRIFAIRENRKAKKPVPASPTVAQPEPGKIVIPGVGAFDSPIGMPQ